MARIVFWLITWYQRALSPLLGFHCRFTPSCSSYFKESVEKHGFSKGVIFGFMRIARCHPFHPGGYDPVNKNK